jgi:uncharacterized membrane protein YphA (DoxX/SURF4 family)
MLPLFYPAILITLVFLFSAFEKIYVFSKSTSKFAKKIGIPLSLAQISISGAILLEIIAPLIIYIYTFTGMLSLIPFFKLAVFGLMAFTVVVTILYHNPMKSMDKYYSFMSNISTLGGLLALYVMA